MTIDLPFILEFKIKVNTGNECDLSDHGRT